MSLSGKIGERIRTSTTVHNLKEAIWDICCQWFACFMDHALRYSKCNTELLVPP